MRALSLALSALVLLAFPVVARAGVPTSAVPTVCSVSGSKFSLCINNGTSAVPVMGLDSTSSNVSVPSLLTVQPTGTSTGVPIQTLYGDRPSVRFFGAKFDGTTDDAAAINAAITYYCSLPNGGNIELPAGTAAIGSTITNQCSNVHIVGHGTGAPFHDIGSSSPDASTVLKWIGTSGGTMMSVSPVASATTGRRLTNDNVEGIQFNCNNLGGTGLDWRSTGGSTIHVSYNECTAYGVRIDTVVLAEFNDPQGNDIWVEGSTILSTGAGILCDGTAGTTSANNGNCSLNQFRHVVLRNKNGDGLVFGYSDHNVVDYLNVQPAAGGASGRTVVFKAGTQIGTSGNGYVAYFNRIIYMTGPESWSAQGTDVAAYPSHDNSVMFLDRNNATPFVTAGTGATVKTWTDSGNLYLTGISNGINTDSPADAWDVNGAINAQSSYKMNHSVIIDSSSNASLNSVTSAGFVSAGLKTVATLPACGTSQKGQILTVTDANGATWGSSITGGGTQMVLALCNGTIWTAH